MNSAIALTLALLVEGNFLHGGYSMEPNWSLCDQAFFGNCWNGIASDDSQFPNLKPISVSVRGLWLVFVNGIDPNDPTGLAQFIFQERVGDYLLMDPEIQGRGMFMKGYGNYNDYKAPSLTLVNDLSLLSNGANRLFETSGSLDGDCIGERLPVKSFSLHGTERWEIFAKNGTSSCIQVEDTHSFVPAIVRDVRHLGFDFDNEAQVICRVVRGCSKAPNEVRKLPNNETFGVLRR